MLLFSDDFQDRKVAAEEQLPWRLFGRRRRGDPASEFSRNALVRNEPDEGNDHVNCMREPWRHERNGDGNEVESGREFALQVTADGCREQ